jgi:environmental stress-induced protein Ves
MTTMPRLLGPADRRAMPWKNGLGTTFEIARAPASDGADFLWRMSLADVTAAGPFSDFAGCERALVVVRGQGMRLRHDGGDWISLGRLQVHRFSGDAPPFGERLAGPVRDFNLIWRRGEAMGELRPVALVRDAEVALTGRVVLVLCLRGACRVALGDGAWSLGDDTALLWQDAAPSLLELRATAAGEATEILVAEVGPIA